jgi:hypothetical protein
MRAIFGIIFFLCGLAIACSQVTVTNWPTRIISKKKHPLTYWINPHVSAVNVLIIDGKRFEHVRGLEKFYLPVPQIGAIIFVTDEDNYSITYHVFKMDTDEDIAIQAKHSIFGRTIGSTNPQDSVNVTDDGKIVLCNLTQNSKSTLPSLDNLYSVKELYYLDLDKKSILADKTLYFDKSGKLIEEHDASPPF